MGSYASEPKVDKESLDEYNDRLNCAASSMQGWRVSQEDAHNCLLNFDTNVSFFAVYDGHGGHEVAQYCSEKLPYHIKETDAYKEGNIEKALTDGFLSFDQTITTEGVIKQLKAIAETEEDEVDEDDEENVANLYEEATMPIEQVIEKYTSNLLNPVVKALRKGDKPPKSPCLKAKKLDGAGEGTSVKCEDAPSTSHSTNESINEDAVKSSDVEKTEDESEQKEGIPKIEISSPGGSKLNGTQSEDEKQKESPQNGDVATDNSESIEVQENGEGTPKGKGKAKMKRITPAPVRCSPRVKLSPNSLYKKLLVLDNNDEDSEDDEDATFDGDREASSEDEDENSRVEGEDDSEDSSEDDDADDEEDDDIDDEEMLEFTRNMKDEPGSDSGCTAVVAVLGEKKLWVANAGDSRCVVCRNGKAIEMSFDHKPEDEQERQRVVKAGGRVTMDGRVNNGLNLSRAIGDHAYKQNKQLDAKEQMITALPDVLSLDLEEGDEFMILACDGIWNSMSSQEVVDYIRPKIKENREKLSSIIEELFDHCLAPNTVGDGTGCDNMTAIIVQFKNNRKRSSSPDCEDRESVKKIKTDSGEAVV